MISDCDESKVDVNDFWWRTYTDKHPIRIEYFIERMLKKSREYISIEELTRKIITTEDIRGYHYWYLASFLLYEERYGEYK